MAYKDRFGKTDIIKTSTCEYLGISWDCYDDPDDITQRTPVLLFTPDIDKCEHYHVGLTREEAQILRDWLTDFLENKETRWK